jgi:cytochrome c
MKNFVGSTRLYLLAICGSLMLAASSCAEEVDASRFQRVTIATNLTQPMELDVASDGSIFLIELAGKIKRIDPATGHVELIGELNVTTEQENGLIGLALDPNFGENGWIYLQYSPPDFVGQHVSRFTFTDNRIDLSTEKLLFKYEEQRRECCHHAGSMEFGPGGNLFIGTGDNTNPFNDSEGFAPIDQRENREPWDAQRSAGNTKSYNGKVLRIHPEPDGTYSIPDGNLFPKDGAVGHPEIYVMGCRNPWRISVDPRNGFLYWGDVGPDAGSDGKRGPRGYDEVNQARQAGNFGWPYFIGDNYAYPIVDFATGEISAARDPNRPINESVNNTGARELPPAVPPLIFYPAAAFSRFPEVGSGGRTACAGPVYYYDETSPSQVKFPAAYDRTIFAFEWSRNWILAVHLDADSRVERLERFLPDMPFTRPIDLQFDRDGSLLVIEYGETWGVNPDARLVRLNYERGNRSPSAVAKASNDVGREPLQVHFSSAGTMDKDHDHLTYQWTAIKSGAEPPIRQRLASTAEADFEFTEPGIYTIELAVSDPHGAASTTSLPIIVGNARPEVEFLEPTSGDFFTPGEEVGYRLVVRDPEDGTSDFEQADESDEWEFIESTAPSRVLVEALPMATDSSGKNDPPGLAMIRKSDCFNCHALNSVRVGPSFVQIADKYRDQPHQLELSVKRVLEGSTGVWGKVAMLPHSQHTPAEVQQMVGYVFSTTAGAANPSVQGFNSKIATNAKDERIQLQATYTDLGRGDIPKLSGTSSIVLRSRLVQAESADEFQGTRPLNSDAAEGKVMMGAIEHGGFLRFNNIAFEQVSRMTVRVASAGAGGTIEIHRGRVDGEFLGSTSVEVNGQWEKFYEKTFDLGDAEGRDDLYLVFKNPENRGGLMNIDSVEFLKK